MDDLGVLAAEELIPEDELKLVRLVDEGIKLDKEIKKAQKRLDEIKAELTNQAYARMDDKNLKYLQIYGSTGHFNTAYKEKLEIDNYNRLVEAVGEIAVANISREEKVKYDVASRFKEALIAVYKQEYSNEMTIEAILQGLGLDGNAIKTALKKLKGDYLKDKKTLESLGVTGACEEELYAIHLYKNFELVERFFGALTPEQVELVKKSVFVEDGISVGFEYQQDNG
jgi:hypothetical protein